MPPFNWVPTPVFSPTQCVCCSGNRDDKGFVDLLADQIPVNGFDENGNPMPVPDGVARFGHLYLCVTCLEQAVHVAGGLSRADAEALAGERDTLTFDIERLEGELERERSPEGKLISVERLVEYLRTPPEPEPEPKPKRGKVKA